MNLPPPPAATPSLWPRSASEDLGQQRARARWGKLRNSIRKAKAGQQRRTSVTWSGDDAAPAPRNRSSSTPEYLNVTDRPPQRRSSLRRVQSLTQMKNCELKKFHATGTEFVYNVLTKRCSWHPLKDSTSQEKLVKRIPRVGMILFPEFEMLDAFGPLEMFSALHHVKRKIELITIGCPADTPTPTPTGNISTSVSIANLHQAVTR